MSRAPQLVEHSVNATIRRRSFWLLVKRGRGTLEVLTTAFDEGRRALPVFSFEEEANLYLRSRVRDKWRARRTGVGELVSLLYTLCRKVELVALDPVSEAEIDVADRLVSLGRERFMHVFLRKRTLVKGLPDALTTIPALDARRGASA